jgi:drug/metabolite transporter (DMT)-like permease
LRATLKNPYLFATLAILCWSSNWLIGRAMRAEVTPVGLTFWRWFVCASLLLPFTGRELWRQRFVIARNWKILATLSATGIAFFHTILYMALHYTTAVNASLVNSTFPISTVLLSWLIFREKATVRQMAGIAVTMVGVAVIVTQGDVERLTGLSFNPGDLLATLAVFIVSAYNVLLQKRPHELRPMTLVTVNAIMALAMLLPLLLWEIAAGQSMHISRNTVLVVVYMGIVPSILAYAFWLPAIQALGANKVGVLSNLHPFFTTVLAILLLGESLHPYHVGGIALILGGIWLASVRKLIPLGARASPASE